MEWEGVGLYMEGKVALVTGGTGGIGSAICRYLHQKGAIVAASYHNGGKAERAKTWQEEQKNQGYQLHIYYGDVSDYDSAGKLVQDVEKELGSLDILINCAGITRDKTLKKMEQEDWTEVLKINLDSVFNVTRHAISGMLKKQYGRIINVSSINGQKGQFGQANYAAAKAGMHGFSKALALEVAKNGITVNTISPGYVNTPMVQKVPNDILDKIISAIPVGRLAEPEEIARIVGFLAAKDSGFITGANFAINGGQHMY